MRQQGCVNFREYFRRLAQFMIFAVTFYLFFLIIGLELSDCMNATLTLVLQMFPNVGVSSYPKFSPLIIWGGD